MDQPVDHISVERDAELFLELDSQPQKFTLEHLGYQSVIYRYY